MATLEVAAAVCRGACTSGPHSTGFPLSRAPVPGARPRTPRAVSLSCCTKCCSTVPPLLPGLGSERFRCSTELFLPRNGPSGERMRMGKEAKVKAGYQRAGGQQDGLKGWQQGKGWGWRLKGRGWRKRAREDSMYLRWCGSGTGTQGSRTLGMETRDDVSRGRRH